MPLISPQLSIKRQLLLWLLLPQLLLWLVGGTLTYRTALSYAEKAIDQSLTQSVRSLARQVKPVGSGLLIDFPKAAQAIIEEDPEDKVSYMVSSPPGQFVLGNANLPEPPLEVRERLKAAPKDAANSTAVQIYQAMVDGNEQEGRRPLRVAAFELDYGESAAPQRLRVQVAKGLAVRERIARELVQDMLVPLLILGAVLSVLVYAGIARGLAPLLRLQKQIGEKRGDTAGTALAPIEMRQAPQEVHALAGAVNQLLATVQRSVSQEKRFINDAAHQLRTPLAGIQAQLDLALAETNPQALQERLAKINAGVERSSHLVHQLLQLARSEVDIALEPVDVVQLARDVARETVPRALAAGVDLGYEGPAGESARLMVRAHPLLLREALSNLVDNALRYGRAAGESRVTIRVREQDDQVVLEVEDNGPGLSPADRLQVFERFYRSLATQQRHPEGAGLGLAIVREIARRHGGEADVADTPYAGDATDHQASGLCVSIRLPLIVD
jgi:two-component system, OmpR family, sensor histidine kinase TctE